MSLKIFTLSLATVASLSLLVACSSTTKSTPSSQASTSQVSETSASSSTTSAKTDTTTNIDGTYKGQDEGDRVTGNTGTWTEVEANGDQEVKKVTFEPKNQKVIIGDDVKIYVAEENQIIIDDMDRDVSDCIVLKK